MKKILLALISLMILALPMGTGMYANYTLERDYKQEWHLADKSSTIEAKSNHIDNFVKKVEDGYAKGEFATYDAIIFKTDNNRFDKNLEALKTLAQRLDELEGMDPNSFQYNTAIQQITQQEQGEAQAMIGVFAGAYCLANYPLAWGWIGGSLVLLSVIGLIVTFVWWLIDI